MKVYGKVKVIKAESILPEIWFNYGERCWG